MLGVEGVEMYPGFFESFEPGYLQRVKQHLDRFGLEAPRPVVSVAPRTFSNCSLTADPNIWGYAETSG